MLASAEHQQLLARHSPAQREGWLRMILSGAQCATQGALLASLREVRRRPFVCLNRPGPKLRPNTPVQRATRTRSPLSTSLPDEQHICWQQWWYLQPTVKLPNDLQQLVLLLLQHSVCYVNQVMASSRLVKQCQTVSSSCLCGSITKSSLHIRRFKFR